MPAPTPTVTNPTRRRTTTTTAAAAAAHLSSRYMTTTQSAPARSPSPHDDPIAAHSPRFSVHDDDSERAVPFGSATRRSPPSVLLPNTSLSVVRTTSSCSCTTEDLTLSCMTQSLTFWHMTSSFTSPRCDADSQKMLDPHLPASPSGPNANTLSRRSRAPVAHRQTPASPCAARRTARCCLRSRCCHPMAKWTGKVSGSGGAMSNW